jgi:hypothetical protein
MGILDSYYGKGGSPTSGDESSDDEFDSSKYSRLKPLSYYAPSAPAPTKPTSSPGITSDIARASGQFVSGVGSTLRDLGAEDIGGAVEQYGTGVVQRNPSEIRSFGDVLSRPFTTTREAVGEVVPQVAAALGGRAAGALAGGLIAGPPGALFGGFIGGLLPAAAQTYGGIRSEQREKGIDERGRALAVTIPAALLERFGGAERVALRVAGEGTEFLARAAGTGFAKNAGKQFARGGVEELVTEIPQTALERYGVSGQTADLTSPEALSEYGVAGAKGFLGGGTVRAGLSSLAGTRQEPTVTIQPDGTITSNQPLTGVEGETDLTGGSNVLMTPAQAEQRLTQIQGRRPQPLAESEFEPVGQRGLFDTRGGPAPQAPVQGEQIDLFGGGGTAPTPVVNEQQGDLFAPAEPSFQTRITAELLDGLGLPRQSSMYRQLLGKDMADPAQQPQIATLFDRVRTDDKISERTKAGIEGLAMQAFGGLAQQQEMIGPRGGTYPQGKPSTQQDAPGPIENLLPTAPMGAAATVPEVAPVAAPVVAQAPAAPAPIAAPSIPIGVDLTPDENRAVRQAKAVFDIAETDADRRNVAAIIQRIVDRASQRSGTPAAQPVTPVGASNAVAAALPAAPVAAGVSSTPVTTGAPLGTQAPKTKQAKTQRAQAPAPAATTIGVREPTEREKSIDSATAVIDLGDGKKITIAEGLTDVYVNDGKRSSPVRSWDKRAGNISDVSQFPSFVPESLRAPLIALQTAMYERKPAAEIQAAREKVRQIADGLAAAKPAPKATTTTAVAEDENTADAQKIIDELGLRPLVGGAADNLNASVQGGRIGVGGLPTFTAKVLTAASNMFTSGRKSRDEQGSKLAQAARDFGAKYLAYLNAAGNMVPSESRTTLKTTKKFPQKGEQAQAESRANVSVDKVEALRKEAQAALTALGQAAGNSAKNVEALIRLNKNKLAAQKKALQEQLGELGAEDGDQALEIDTEIKALEKLDIGLSQGWAAAKRGTFRTDSDVLDVRGGGVRTSTEEQGEGFAQPLVNAAKNGYSLNKFTKAETGFQGVLNYIRSSGTPFERMIAKAVSEVFKNTKNPPKVVFSEGKSQFDPKKNTVTMSPTASPEVALHEALHAALQWFVHSFPKDPIVRQLIKSVNQVVKYDTTKLSGKAAEVQKVLADLVAGDRELDAVLELISYGNTLVEFRKALEAMPSKGTPASFVQAAKDVWNMILATVRRMLGVNNSAASDVIMGSFRLLQQAAETTPTGKGKGNILKAAVSTTTDAFKRWFGDSKIVGKDGNPLVVYHGTDKDFDTFDISRSGSSSGEYLGKGFYFSQSADMAGAFAGEKNALVMPVYLAINNPFNTASTDLTKAQKQLIRDDPKLGKNFLAAEAEAGGDAFSSWYVVQRAAVMSKDRSNYIKDALELVGFDGVITGDLNKQPGAASEVEVVAFRREQIKSSIGNRGTYDPASGNILEAAVQSTDPTTAPTIDAAAQQVGFADATAFANGPGKFKTPTQLVFELVGLGRVNGKDLPLTAGIASSGAKLANYIRKEVPTLERAIMLFNSNFSNSPATVAAVNNYKFLSQTGHLQMEKIATTIAARPELREPFLDYMDGDTKALDGIKDASGFKAIADNLKGLMQQYISTLPANSKERRAFESMPFTQYIINPTSISQVAGSTLSAGKIASMVGVKTQKHESLEEFEQFLDATDGTLDQDQLLYQMFEEKLGNTIPVGFISKVQYDKTGVTPAGFSVDASRVWKFSEKYDAKKGKFEFSSSITTREALKKLKNEDLALALVNTTAALSHAHAATTYFGNLASIGREDGKPTAEAVAFDNVGEINAVFGDRKLELNNVLQVSDEASKSQALRWQTQRTGTWVQLPKGPTYGALAGKIIPGPVWNAMLDMHDRSPAVNFKSFNELMAFFKQSKTVLNPGTHVTNVLSNVALLILHGIRLSTMSRAARMYANFERNPDSMSDANRALVQAFFNSGAVLGQFTNSELKGSVYDRLSAAITPTSDQSYITRMTSMAKFEQAKSTLKGWKDNAVEVYAAEDNVFRFAAFLETAGNVQLRDGTKQLNAKQLEEVGLAARKMFLDYDIDARAIRAARQTFLPFVSWSYAIIPVLGRIAVTKPWAIVNMMASVMLMQAALGGEEDDELRKKGPDYLRERSLFGLGPYMHMRIPFVGDDQNPTYLNIGKYIPFLSLLQPAPGESPFAGQSWLPGFANPSGPLVTLISAMNGYDPFTGKPMHAPTDTEWDKLVTTGKAAYDTMAPPVVTSKFWGQISDLKDGAMGPTGVEKSSMFLARTLGGLGLYQFNVDEAAFYQRKDIKEIKKDYKAAMTKAKREEYRKGYPDYEALDKELDTLRDRMQKALTKARGEE